jgi:hypothetical protein
MAFKSTTITGPKMRKFAFILMTLTAACSTQPNHVGNSLLLPLNALGSSLGNATYNATRGKVQVYV